MGLAKYKAKRNFGVTPEPAEGGDGGRGIFVVQLHHASHRHFDFRLEFDGVLKSWAVPKGPSFDPAVKRLAMEVEDHPISYADFEGDIPAGNYGAGHVDTFDRGTWQSQGSARQGLAKGELKFTLYGDVLRGSWVLVRTRKQGSKQQWLLIKHQDDYSGPRDADAFVDPKTDRPIPLMQRRKTWSKAGEKAAEKRSVKPNQSRRVEPILEASSDAPFTPELCSSQDAPPTGDRWLHEVKWDGYRILATVAAGKVRLWSRNHIEWTAKLPELVRALKSLKLKSAQLDGEMIVLRDGRADFNALQGRLAAENQELAIYVLFDMPYLNGKSYRAVPLIQRKAALAAILARHAHPLLKYSEHQVGNGASLFAQATAGGLEGIVSKRIDSPYRGSRNGDWVKIKARPSDEFVLIGYTEPKGSRAGIGALLLAQPRDGKLVYVGRVGTGFSDQQLLQLRKQLSKLHAAEPAADIELMERKDRKLAIWVKPKLIVEVFYQGYGSQGLLRQVAFKAIRPDKGVKDLQSGDRRRDLGGKKREDKKIIKSTVGTAKGKAPSPGVEFDFPVTITHPEREVFPGSGITKGHVAQYYNAIAHWILPEVVQRPLSIMRCPDGAGKACFFQKHLSKGLGKHVHGVTIKTKEEDYLYIKDLTGLLELVQMNVLELHPWGAKIADPERADRIVFDLDPHPKVPWPRMIAAAREVRKRLDSIGLLSFLRTSGGKGLHVVVPLKPAVPWGKAKRFAEGVADAMAQMNSEEFVSVAGENKRVGKIFIDWLRNSRGATSVASYSLRARASAGVAMPISWNDLAKIKSGDAFTIRNAVRHLKARRKDPWGDIAKVRQALPHI